MADTDNIENIGNMLDNARTKFMRELDRYENLGRLQDLPKEKQESLFDKARTQYQENVRSIQRSDPATFKMWQDSQQERYVDTLNKLAFDSNPDLPYDEELGDELQYLLTMPYGSEAEKGLDLSETTSGFATPFFQNQKEVMVSMGADDPETVARHEGFHEITGGEPFYTTDDKGQRKGYDTEIAARAFDYLRAVVEGDEELANKTEQFVIRGSDNNIGGYGLLKLAIEAIPQMYERGVFSKDKATLDTAQKVIKQIDEDEQGFIDSILGEDPEKVKKPTKEIKDPLYLLSDLKSGDEDAVNDLKELLSILPFSKKESEKDYNDDYYTVQDRSEIEMSTGGLASNEYNKAEDDMIKTEAGEKMKKENPNKELPEKADINKDGEFQAWEKARHEAIQAAKAEMNCGGLMGDGMGVIIGIEAESGNEIPAGSKPEEVADDIPAMLSEGEYVVPADVVRWHGVKTFEALRGEAKMGMGLMAEDGRIAEVDEETKKPVDYDIEEKDKPEVEKAEVEVVHAATGVDVTPDTTTPEPPTTYYSYKWTLDPETNRYRMVPVDPDSGQVVTSETFDPARSTRYAPRDVLAREVYGRPLGEPEKDQECPEGTVYDEEIGACVPVEPASVTQPTGLGGEGDGAPLGATSPTPYSEQMSTKIAERLGPLSAEDLADYEGETLAERALSRATEDRGITPVKAGIAVLGGPLGVAGLAGRQMYNEVGAKRAMMTRTNELSNWGNITDGSLANNMTTAVGVGAGGLESDMITTGDLAYTGPRTYNASFNPNTASFDVTSTSRITGIQKRDDGSAWATDYQHTDSDGNDIDAFDPSIDEDTWGGYLDDIDNEIESQPTTTGSDSDSDESGNDSPSGTDVGSNDASTTEDSGYSSSFNKGGMPVRKNTPKVAMMKYSKGSK